MKNSAPMMIARMPCTRSNHQGVGLGAAIAVAVMENLLPKLND
jgi:hypothetical protein